MEIKRVALHKMLESYGGFRHLSISLNKANLIAPPSHEHLPVTADDSPLCPATHDTINCPFL